MLANIVFLFLAGDVVPFPIGPNPDAVLVVVVVVGFPLSPVLVGQVGFINPGERSLIKEVRQTNPSS